MADNMVASSSRQPAEDVPNNERFQGKHRDYIASKIEDIWRCLVGEHYLCILTAEGEHHQLQPEDVQLWVDAIVGTSSPSGHLRLSIEPPKASGGSHRQESPSHSRNKGSSESP